MCSNVGKMVAQRVQPRVWDVLKSTHHRIKHCLIVNAPRVRDLLLHTIAPKMLKGSAIFSSKVKEFWNSDLRKGLSGRILEASALAIAKSKVLVRGCVQLGGQVRMRIRNLFEMRSAGRLTKVFISATTSDLGFVRRLVVDALLSKGCYPVEQSHFGMDFRTVRQMLHERITEVDAVIHIAGLRYGAEPPSENIDPEHRRSFTQFEYDLANELGKRVYTVVCSDDFPFESGAEIESPDRVELQRLHRESLLGGERRYETAKTPEELISRIYTMKLDVLKLKDDRSEYEKGQLLAWASGVACLAAICFFVFRQWQGHETLTNAIAQSQGQQREIQQQIVAGQHDVSSSVEALDHWASGAVTEQILSEISSKTTVPVAQIRLLLTEVEAAKISGLAMASTRFKSGHYQECLALSQVVGLSEERKQSPNQAIVAHAYSLSARASFMIGRLTDALTQHRHGDAASRILDTVQRETWLLTTTNETLDIVCYAEDDFVTKKQWLEDLIQVCRKSSPAYDELKNNTLLRLANVFRQSKLYAEAWKACDEVKLHPSLSCEQRLIATKARIVVDQSPKGNTLDLFAPLIKRCKESKRTTEWLHTVSELLEAANVASVPLSWNDGSQLFDNVFSIIPEDAVSAAPPSDFPRVCWNLLLSRAAAAHLASASKKIYSDTKQSEFIAEAKAAVRIGEATLEHVDPVQDGRSWATAAESISIAQLMIVEQMLTQRIYDRAEAAKLKAEKARSSPSVDPFSRTRKSRTGSTSRSQNSESRLRAILGPPRQESAQISLAERSLPEAWPPLNRAAELLRSCLEVSHGHLTDSETARYAFLIATVNYTWAKTASPEEAVRLFEKALDGFNEAYTSWRSLNNSEAEKARSGRISVESDLEHLNADILRAKGGRTEFDKYNDSQGLHNLLSPK